MAQHQTTPQGSAPLTPKEALDTISQKAKADLAAANAEHDKVNKDHSVQAFFGVGTEAFKRKIEAIAQNTEKEIAAFTAATEGTRAAAHQVHEMAKKEIAAHPKELGRVQEDEIKQLTNLVELTNNGELQLIRDKHGKAAIEVRDSGGRIQTYELGTGNFHAEPAAGDLISPGQSVGAPQNGKDHRTR